MKIGCLPTENHQTQNRQIGKELVIDDQGSAINAVICAQTGQGSSILLENTTYDLIKNGHGFIADSSIFSNNFMEKIGTEFEESKRNIIYIDLSRNEVKNCFTYNPFAQKSLDEIYDLICLFMDEISPSDNAGTDYYKAKIAATLQSLVWAHNKLYGDINLKHLFNYLTSPDHLKILLLAVKSTLINEENYSGFKNSFDHFNMDADNPITDKAFQNHQSLFGGIVGRIASLHSEFGSLFDTENEILPSVNFKAEILNQSAIILDTFGANSSSEALKTLRAVMSADLGATLQSIATNRSLEKVFTLILDKKSVISNKIRSKLMAVNRITRISTINHYMSYQDYINQDSTMLGMIDGNSHTKIFFKGTTDSNTDSLKPIGLTTEQLLIKDGLELWQCLVLRSGQVKVLNLTNPS